MLINLWFCKWNELIFALYSAFALHFRLNRNIYLLMSKKYRILLSISFFYNVFVSLRSWFFFCFSPLIRCSLRSRLVGAVNREKESREGSVPFLGAVGINSGCLFHSHPFYRQRDFCITLCIIPFPLRNLPVSLARICQQRHRLFQDIAGLWLLISAYCLERLFFALWLEYILYRRRWRLF